MPEREQVRVHPDAGIPDLIRRLADDSKRLASDEVRLAKLEVRESAHTAARGTLWLALSFGIGVVALTAATIAVAAGIGVLFNGHMWVGAMITGVVELGAAFVLIKRGAKSFGSTSYTLPESREALKDSLTWASHVRAD